jgi:hypothetical protein
MLLPQTGAWAEGKIKRGTKNSVLKRRENKI